jgi:hypothetical protein
MATITPVDTATPMPTATATASPTATDTPDGFVPVATFRERQLDYLRFATAGLAPGSVTNVIAHMQRARIDPTFDIAPGAVPAAAWDAIFAKIDTLQDTRDFDGLELLNVLYDYADDPLLAPGLIEKVEQTLLSFKFWYTEPTPDGVIDESYYWTENHQILYHALEYLMGQRHPDRAIGRDGRTGAEHLEHARALLMQFDFRARYGFTEWHSNVYYQGGPRRAADAGGVRRGPGRPAACRGDARRAALRHRHPHPCRQLRRHPRPLVQEGQDDRPRRRHLERRAPAVRPQRGRLHLAQ